MDLENLNLEDHPNSSLMDSEEKPDLGKLASVEIEQQKAEDCSSDKLGDLGSLVQEGMVRVCLTSGYEVIDCSGSSEAEAKAKAGDENGVRDYVKQDTNNLEVVSDGVKSSSEIGMKNGTGDVNGGGELEDSEEDESSSSSSGSSTGDDDDDDEAEEESDDEEDEEASLKKMEEWSDDEDGNVVKGPIRSKNEIQDLPPVPAVTVTIKPHHQTLPVGVVLSIMGAQVIVEGVETNNPLNDGSILWITESRTPLGVVDEIFGPVKNPYYIIRYNSDTEIPTGVKQGCLISFVPEFADYVLNSSNNLYKKGYDASGANDEELSEEMEFSDDEKEAEYKKMLKMSKRGSNEQNMKKGKKSRNRGGKCKNNPQPLVNSPVNGCSSGGPQAPNFTPHGVWPNGLLSIPPQNNSFPCNVPPFIQPSFVQQPVQNLGVLTLPPFNPQFNTSIGQMFPCNFGPQNSGAFACWPQNNFNQSQVWQPMGLPHGVPSMPNGLDPENSNNRAGFVGAGDGNVESCPNPNPGNGFSNHGERKPFQKGGGRFRGGRRKP